MEITRKGRGVGLIADSGTWVSKNDSVTFSPGRVYVGYAGTVVLVSADDETVTFPAVPAGTVLPILAKIIAAASTASGFVILR